MYRGGSGGVGGEERERERERGTEVKVRENGRLGWGKQEFVLFNQAVLPDSYSC